MQGSIILVVLCGCLSVDLSVSARLFYHFVASLLQCRVSWFLWSSLVTCPWIFLYLLGGFSFLFCRFFDAGLPDFRGPVWLFVRGSFCIYSAGFCSFFCFFTAGFPDFRLPRAPEQGGAPRLPAEEAAAAGACAPAPANGASPGLERMLTEMQMQCGWKERGDKEGRDGRRRKPDWERESGG